MGLSTCIPPRMSCCVREQDLSVRLRLCSLATQNPMSLGARFEEWSQRCEEIVSMPTRFKRQRVKKRKQRAIPRLQRS
jgi:hypothetical protein